MPRPKGCKCGVLKEGEVCPVHGDPEQTSISVETTPIEPAAPAEAETAPAGEKAAKPRRPKSRAKRRRDPRPSPKRTSATAVPKGPNDGQLEDMLRKMLKMCSVPMRLRCDFCADHMLDTADQAAAAAIKDKDLRDALVFLYTQWDRYAGVGVLAMWLGVPVLHHLAPAPVYRLAAPVVGLPPRGVTASAHAHTNGHGPAPEPEPMVTGLEGLDLEQLAGMAEAMGIKIDLPADILGVADEPTADSAPSPPDSEADSAEPAEISDSEFFAESPESPVPPEAEAPLPGADPDAI